MSSSNRKMMISVDDLPVSGKAMPLGKRPSTNKSTTSTNFDSGNESKSSSSTTMGASRIRSVTNAEFEKPSFIKSVQSTNGFIKSENLDLTPPRSPLEVHKPLLLRPVENSPFAYVSNQSQRELQFHAIFSNFRA